MSRSTLKLVTTLNIAAFVGMLLTACGGGGGGGADNNTGGSSSGGTTPPPATYTIGGTVNGISGTLVLQDNGADNLSVSTNGSFAFTTALASGTSYAVTIASQPAGQICTVVGGAGTVSSADVSSIAVTCANAITGMVLTGGAQGTGHGVGGETVTLYDATSPTSGMGAGTAPVVLGTATTATDGSFAASFSSSLCPAANSGTHDVVYVVASPGSNNSSNPIRLMSVVGPCATLAASTSQSVGVINELTTVGAAYTLNWFVGYDGKISVTTNQPANGLQVAIATYGALVDYSTGSVATNLTTNQPAATNTLNALANSLAACTTSGNASSNACSQLLSATTLPGYSPSDTLGAALNVAHYPGQIGTGLFISTATPYSPALTAAPNDWTLVETFYNVGGLSNPLGLAIDSVGDIWVVNNPVGGGAADGSNGGLSIFSSTGNALNTFGITTPGTFYGPERIAIGPDDTGDADIGWITNMPYSYQGSAAGFGRVIQFQLSGTLSNCPVSSTACSLASAGYVKGSSAPSPGFAQPQGIALDNLGNAWVASLFQGGPPGVAPGVLTEISNALTPSTPIADANDTNTSNGGPQYQDVGVDGQGNIWVLDGANGLLQEYNPGSSTWLNGAGFGTTNNAGLGINAGYAPNVGNQLAIDSSGNVWVAQSSNTTQKLFGFNSSGVLPNLLTESDLQAPNAIAIDGNGDVFVVNAGSGTCLVEIGMQGGTWQDLSYNPSTQSACGLGNYSFYDTYGIAIDQAGNLWAVNYDGPTANGALVEVVGAGFPTVTPLYQAQKGGATAAARGQRNDRARR